MRRRLSPETAQRSRKKYNRGAGQTVTKRRYVLEVIATGSSTGRRLDGIGAADLGIEGERAAREAAK